MSAPGVPPLAPVAPVPLGPRDLPACLAALVGHPGSFLPAYFLALALPGFWTVTGTNTGQPVLPLFLVLLAAVAGLRYGLWRLGRRLFRRSVGARALAVWVRANTPALWSLPVTGFLTVVPVEGNAFGIALFPLLLVAWLVVGVLVHRRLRAVDRA